MYHTEDERAVIAEGKRLSEMYTPGSKRHAFGKTLLRFISQRSTMLKRLSQLTWLIEQAESELMENIAYIEAVNFIEGVGAQVEKCNRPTPL